MANKKCYGIIVMIDALGIRNYSITECQYFLKIREELIGKSSFRWNAAASCHDPKTGNTSECKIHFQSFADTLIIAIEMKEFSNNNDMVKFPTSYPEYNAMFYGIWIERLSFVLGDLLKDALMDKIVFRGALSAGEYILDKKSNSILGPAINDVANWYEAFDCTGIILTPHAAAIVDLMTSKRAHFNCLVKTKIPLKNNQIKDCYVVNWPNAFFKDDYSEDNIKKAKNDFLVAMSQLAIPIGTENKYEYLLSFFNEVVAKIADQITEDPPRSSKKSSPGKGKLKRS